MTTHRLDVARLTIRDDPGSELDGYGVRWGSIAAATEYGPEAFAPGSFRDAIAQLGDRPVPFLDRHDGEVIGVLRPAEDDIGLKLDGRLFASPAAASWRERQAAGIDGASLEFAPGRASRSSAGVTIHRQVARLVAVAASYKPAHDGARLSTRDMEDPTVMIAETPAPPAPEPPEPAPEPEPITLSAVQGIVHREVGELGRRMAERGALQTAEDPWSLVRDMDGLGALAQAALVNTELRGVLVRALADQLTTGNPGVMTPGVIQDVKGLFSRSRPAIESWGREGMDGSGMSVDWPVFATALSTIVGEQVTQKTEVTSVVVPITKGTAPIKSYAGGSDVAYQLIRRSSPSYLAALERIYLEAYAVVTDAAMLAAMQTAGPAATIVINWTTATQAQMQEAAFTASAMIQDATGAPAGFVLVPLAVFTKIGGVLMPPPVFNQAGTASAAQLRPTLSGLDVLYHPGVAAGTAIFSNDLAGSWHEDGPFLITDEDVAKLGQNVAVWGMGAAAAYIPAAIVKTKAA